jgi:hypothetical protein
VQLAVPPTSFAAADQLPATALLPTSMRLAMLAVRNGLGLAAESLARHWVGIGLDTGLSRRFGVGVGVGLLVGSVTLCVWVVAKLCLVVGAEGADLGAAG